MHGFSRWHAVALTVAIATAHASAQTSATWSQTAAGTYDWPDNANWGGNPFPDAGGTANLGIDIAGAQTINLNQLITLGGMTIGDATGTSIFTIPPGTAGSFAFNGGTTVTAQGGANVISAPVALGPTITFAGEAGSLTISGQVTGSGTSFLKTGPSDLIVNNPTNSFTHPVTVFGGRLNATVLATDGTPFGAGSITLDSGTIRAALTTTAGAINVTAAGGPGGTLTFAGGSNLVFNKNGAANTLTITFGDPAATSSSLVRSGRGTLALATVTAVGSAATGTERVFVNGGVPTVSPGGTNPNTYVPAYINSILSSGSQTTADFLTYDATNGFQIATYTSTDITTSTAVDVVNQTTAATLTGPAQAFGLKTTQALNLNGNTLTLGNGSGTAGLYLSSAIPATTPSLNGPGTVAFGGAEGLLFIPGNTPITGDITFTGTNGLTMFSTTNSSNARAAIRNNVTVATDFIAQMGIILAETTAANPGPFTAVLKVGTPAGPAAFTLNAPATLNSDPGFLYLGFRNSASGGNSNGTLDLTNASSVNILTENIHVGRATSQGGTGASTGALLMPIFLTAPVNVTATGFIAVGGDNQSSPASNGLPTAQIVFGAGPNTVVTPQFEIGGFNSDGNVTIRTNGSLQLSGPNNSATNLLMADNAIGTQSATFAATTTLDLTGGRITATLGTVQLAVGNATGTGAASATFTIDGVTSAVTMDTATLGNVRGTGDASGTLVVKNGNVTINFLNLTSVAAAGTAAASGTLRLTNDGTNPNTGTVTLNGPIITSAGQGAGTRTSTIDLLDGTLNMQNNDIEDVTTFNFTGGTLRNPGTITRSAVAFNQTGGTLSRNAAGTTTIVGGAYNLTAPAVANVSAGTLLVNGSTGSAPGTGTVNVTGSGTVGSGGTLGGTGTINGNIVVSSTVAGTQGGTLSPGASIGTLTVGSGAMTWNPGGSYLLEHNVQAASPATAGVDNDFVSSAGALSLANLTPGSFNINLVATNVPPAPTSFTPVQYTLGTFAGGVTGPGGADLSGQNITGLFNFSGTFASAPSVVVSPTGGSVIVTFSPVPEPAGVLVACGLAGGLAWWKRRRKPLAA
jgi:hypothetical protein